MSQTVAIIPARGGSKRIPKKNIKDFCGKPMLAYPIEAAKRSGLFDRVIVSTDSDEVATVAKRLGTEVPFMRPEHLANDHAVLADVIAHAIEALKADVKFTCCILPTAPMLQPEDLKAGLEAMKTNGAPAAISVARFAYPIFRGLKTDRDGRIEMIWPENELVRSNDLPEAFHDAGLFYWLKADAFMKTRKIFMPGSLPVFLPRYRVQDIDTPEDWDMAEILFRAFQTRAKK